MPPWAADAAAYIAVTLPSFGYVDLYERPIYLHSKRVHRAPREVGYHHARALNREPQCTRPPDATRRTGDYRNLPSSRPSLLRRDKDVLLFAKRK